MLSHLTILTRCRVLGHYWRLHLKVLRLLLLCLLIAALATSSFAFILVPSLGSLIKFHRFRHQIMALELTDTLRRVTLLGKPKESVAFRHF